MSLMPAFDRFPAEAKLIGTMIAGYGELEYMLAICVGQALGNQDAGIRTLFRMRTESGRLDALDPILRLRFKETGLEDDYADMLGCMRFCLKVRNNLTHSHWADSMEAGLFFTNVQDAVESSESLEHKWRHVDVTILQALHDYFVHTAHHLRYLEYEYRHKVGKGRNHTFLKPTKRERPILHNPPAEHVPPWLGEDQKKRHLEWSRRWDESGHSRKAKP